MTTGRASVGGKSWLVVDNDSRTAVIWHKRCLDFDFEVYPFDFLFGKLFAKHLSPKPYQHLRILAHAWRQSDGQVLVVNYLFVDVLHSGILAAIWTFVGPLCSFLITAW
jgi:hypothetical protein